MSSSDSVLCLLAWVLHTNVFQPRRVRIRLLDLTLPLNNYKFKKITPTSCTHYEVIRAWTPWTCNYVTEMIIFWSGVLACCIKCIFAIIKFTIWHVDIAVGTPITWSYQIWATNRVTCCVFVRHVILSLGKTPPFWAASGTQHRCCLLGLRASWKPEANSWCYLKEPYCKAKMTRLK